MNKWDKVEKSGRRANENDIFVEYLKIACFLILGSLYFYYILLGR